MEKNPNDIFLWPSGSWCYREDILDHLPEVEDFEIIFEGTDEHAEIETDSENQFFNNIVGIE